MDDKDRKLIALLRVDARMPVSSLAGHLGVSRATVQNRLQKLTESGVIQGFAVRLKSDVIGAQIRAITLVQVGAKKTQTVVSALTGLPEVKSLHTTNGKWDIIAEINTETLEEFDQVIGRMQDVPGVLTTETNLLLTSHKM